MIVEYIEGYISSCRPISVGKKRYGEVLSVIAILSNFDTTDYGMYVVNGDRILQNIRNNLTHVFPQKSVIFHVHRHVCIYSVYVFSTENCIFTVYYIDMCIRFILN